MNLRLRITSMSYWMIVIPLYCCVSFYILWHYAGPSAAGSGTSPGLIRPGLHPPSVSLREYLGSWRIRLEYQLPYFVVALIFSVTGCCIPSWLLSRIPGSPRILSLGLSLLRCCACFWAPLSRMPGPT